MGFPPAIVSRVLVGESIQTQIRYHNRNPPKSRKGESFIVVHHLRKLLVPNTCFLRKFNVNMNPRKRQPKVSESLFEEGKITTLKAIRETTGLSQFDFCKETDLAITPVSKCENGHTEMLLDINQCQKFEMLLQSRLGLSITDLPKSLKSPAPPDFLRRLREIQRTKFINV